MCLELQQGVLSVSASVMASSPAVLMRLVASAYAVAEKAGTIVRKVLQSGQLGIVEKVRQVVMCPRSVDPNTFPI